MMMDSQVERDFERRIRDLEEATRGVALRVTRGGGGEGELFNPREVDEFPAIPESGWDVVLFTGDNQFWWTYAGNVRWYPDWKFTSYDGLPGTEA